MKIERNKEKLKVVSKEVDLGDKEKLIRLTSLLMNCYEKHFHKNVQGLSAIQLGYNESCILVQYDKTKQTPPLVCFNPKILFSIGFRQSNEGCVSVGEDRYVLFRPMLCKVSYYTEDSVKHVEWLPFKKARIFCHETDHTKGILISDKGVKICQK